MRKNPGQMTGSEIKRKQEGVTTALEHFTTNIYHVSCKFCRVDGHLISRCTKYFWLNRCKDLKLCYKRTSLKLKSETCLGHQNKLPCKHNNCEPKGNISSIYKNGQKKKKCRYSSVHISSRSKSKHKKRSTGSVSPFLQLSRGRQRFYCGICGPGKRTMMKNYLPAKMNFSRFSQVFSNITFARHAFGDDSSFSL